MHAKKCHLGFYSERKLAMTHKLIRKNLILNCSVFFSHIYAIKNKLEYKNVINVEVLLASFI